MPRTLTVAAGVTVHASPEHAWELLVNWGRQREWIWATRVSGGHGPGAEVVARTGIGPVGFTDFMLITTWEPPRRCVVTHTGKLVRGDAEFEVRPRGADCEVRWIEHVELSWLPPALAKLAAAVIAPVARAGLGTSLIRFARLAQAGS